MVLITHVLFMLYVHIHACKYVYVCLNAIYETTVIRSLCNSYFMQHVKVH